MKYGHLRRGNPGHEARCLKGGWVFQLFTMFLMQFLLAAAAVALYEDEIFASGGFDVSNGLEISATLPSGDGCDTLGLSYRLEAVPFRHTDSSTKHRGRVVVTVQRWRPGTAIDITWGDSTGSSSDETLADTLHDQGRGAGRRLQEQPGEEECAGFEMLWLSKGCEWTMDFACPASGVQGALGVASADGSKEFRCCCGDSTPAAQTARWASAASQSEADKAAYAKAIAALEQAPPHPAAPWPMKPPRAPPMPPGEPPRPTRPLSPTSPPSPPTAEALVVAAAIAAVHEQVAAETASVQAEVLAEAVAAARHEMMAATEAARADMVATAVAAAKQAATERGAATTPSAASATATITGTDVATATAVPDDFLRQAVSSSASSAFASSSSASSSSSSAATEEEACVPEASSIKGATLGACSVPAPGLSRCRFLLVQAPPAGRGVGGTLEFNLALLPPGFTDATLSSSAPQPAQPPARSSPLTPGEITRAWERHGGGGQHCLVKSVWARLPRVSCPQLAPRPPPPPPMPASAPAALRPSPPPRPPGPPPHPPPLPLPPPPPQPCSRLGLSSSLATTYRGSGAKPMRGQVRLTLTLEQYDRARVTAQATSHVLIDIAATYPAADASYQSLPLTRPVSAV